MNLKAQEKEQYIERNKAHCFLMLFRHICLESLRVMWKEEETTILIYDSLKRSVGKRQGQRDVWAVIRTAQQSSEGKRKEGRSGDMR